MADAPRPSREGEGSAGDARPLAVRLAKFPYPYEAAFTVASDIDNASYDRFTAVHALFCGREVIRPGTRPWQTLGLSESSPWYDPAAGGVRGLGLELADSFFLVADDVSMGMYRHDQATGNFVEGSSDGHNTCEAIRGWIKTGQMDAFHSFLHHRRDQLLPLLSGFYAWCEREGVAKPMTWINHSLAVTPTGLCPSTLRPNRLVRLGRLMARAAVGPLFGRSRRPLGEAFVWYLGDTPGSPYYVNDVLSANGLRYVWLNMSADSLANVVALPEHRYGDESSILDVVTMDDGVRYFRFPRCYGKVDPPPGFVCALRQAGGTIDTSVLLTEANLERLCREGGTCILYTHWTLARGFPLSDETLGRFQRVRTYRDAGRLWVAPLSRLLEWTRRRTFLRYTAHRENGRIVIDIVGVQDPVVGQETLRPQDAEGLAFTIPGGTGAVVVRVGRDTLPAEAVHTQGDLCWVRFPRVGSGGADPGARRGTSG